MIEARAHAVVAEEQSSRPCHDLRGRLAESGSHMSGTVADNQLGAEANPCL